MDLYNVENRLMILDCLRENSANMRIEQSNLRDRISQALVRARTSLMCIRQLNIELQEMKLTVDNALANEFQNLVDYDELNAVLPEDLSNEPMIQMIDDILEDSRANPIDFNENAVDEQ